MGQRSSVYLGDDLAAAVKASGQPLAELIRRGLAARAEPAGVVVDSDNSTPAASPLGAIGPGDPSPGVVCMGPGCWQRDTRKYGLRSLPLCTACAAALRGEAYKREIPPSAARIMRRGAA